MIGANFVDALKMMNEENEDKNVLSFPTLPEKVNNGKYNVSDLADLIHPITFLNINQTTDPVRISAMGNNQLNDYPLGFFANQNNTDNFEIIKNNPNIDPRSLWLLDENNRNLALMMLKNHIISSVYNNYCTMTNQTEFAKKGYLPLFQLKESAYNSLTNNIAIENILKNWLFKSGADYDFSICCNSDYSDQSNVNADITNIIKSQLISAIMYSLCRSADQTIDYILTYIDPNMDMSRNRNFVEIQKTLCRDIDFIGRINDKSPELIPTVISCYIKEMVMKDIDGFAYVVKAIVDQAFSNLACTGYFIFNSAANLILEEK